MRIQAVPAALLSHICGCTLHADPSSCTSPCRCCRHRTQRRTRMLAWQASARRAPQRRCARASARRGRRRGTRAAPAGRPPSGTARSPALSMLSVARISHCSQDFQTSSRTRSATSRLFKPEQSCITRCFYEQRSVVGSCFPTVCPVSVAADTHRAGAIRSACAKHLKEVVRRDELRAARPVEEAVDVRQRHHAARPLHARRQEVRQLQQENSLSKRPHGWRAGTSHSGASINMPS